MGETIACGDYSDVNSWSNTLGVRELLCDVTFLYNFRSDFINIERSFVYSMPLSPISADLYVAAYFSSSLVNKCIYNFFIITSPVSRSHQSSFFFFFFPSKSELRKIYGNSITQVTVVYEFQHRWLQHYGIISGISTPFSNDTTAIRWSKYCDGIAMCWRSEHRC